MDISATPMQPASSADGEQDGQANNQKLPTDMPTANGSQAAQPWPYPYLYPPYPYPAMPGAYPEEAQQVAQNTNQNPYVPAPSAAPVETTRPTTQVQATGAARQTQASIQPGTPEHAVCQDLSYIDRVTRIAVYDDALSSPRIVDIQPNETRTYIAQIASTTYNLAKEAGGRLPYTVILELCENFIHASFIESVISILDGGNTIRFSDQGPGIEKKSLAQQPGFSSATSQMKDYIRGVGSGFPIVRSYLEVQKGRLLIEDNINRGTVITISVGRFADSSDVRTIIQSDGPQAGSSFPTQKVPSTAHDQHPTQPDPELSEREWSILYLADEREGVRLTDVTKEYGYPNSSVHNLLGKLCDLGFLQRDPSQRTKVYILTSEGNELLANQDSHR